MDVRLLGSVRVIGLKLCCVTHETVPFDHEPALATGTPPGVGYISNSGQGMAGWTMLGGDNIGVNNRSQPFYDNGLNPDGEYVALLQRGVKAINQVVEGLVPGQDYDLSYAFNARAWGNQHAHLEVTIGPYTAQDSDVSTREAQNSHTLPFYTTSFTFTAEATGMALQFESTRNDQDNTVLIDDVRLAAVPEVGTLFILR